MIRKFLIGLVCVSSLLLITNKANAQVGAGPGGGIFISPAVATTSGPNTFTGAQTININGIATTSTDALVLANNTAATVGVPVQMSPRLRFRAHVLNTTGNVDNTNDWWIESLPISAATPSGNLNFMSSLNGAAATLAVSFSSAGGGNISTGTFAPTGFVYLPNGTEALPSLGFQSDHTTGLRLRTSAIVDLSLAATTHIDFARNGSSIWESLASDVLLGWSSGNPSSVAPDTGLSRTGVSTLSLGNGTASNTTGILNLGKGYFGDGTALLPAMSFGSETTLGFWRSSAANVTLQGGFTATGQITSPSNVNGAAFRSGIFGSALIVTSDGQWKFQNNAGTIGIQLKMDALPTVSSGFGTSPSLTAGSTPLAGQVNVGTGGVATSGVLNFNGTAFPSAPFCMCEDNSSLTPGVCRASATTTQLTLTTTVAWVASDLVTFMCISSK